MNRNHLSRHGVSTQGTRLGYIDSIVLNWIERTCRLFQRLTGRTNVWLAVQLTNLSIVVYFVWATVYAWSGNAVQWTVFVLFCGALLWILAQTIFRTPIEVYETAAYARVAKGFRNPRRIRDAFLRISFLTLTIMLGYPVVFVFVQFRVMLPLLTYSLIVLTTAVLYLLACDPLPPCVGRLKVWLRGAAPSRVAAPDSDVG